MEFDFGLTLELTPEEREDFRAILDNDGYIESYTLVDFMAANRERVYVNHVDLDL